MSQVSEVCHAAQDGPLLVSVVAPVELDLKSKPWAPGIAWVLDCHRGP